MLASRSEGLATAMEETLMQAGLDDDNPRGREIVWIMLANRAARGLASLYVQANQMSLQQAGRFHAQWTPRGWSVSFFFQAEDGIRDYKVTGVQTCALPI